MFSSVSSSILIGALAASMCALASTVASLLKFKGASTSKPISLTKPFLAAKSLLASRNFMLGLALAAVGSLCNGLALYLAPMTVVKPIAAASLVMLGFAASLMLGIKASRRQQLGLLLVAAGLAGIVLTANGHSVAGQSSSFLMFEAGALLLAGALLMWAKLKSLAFMLACSAGVVAGSVDALVKQLPHLGSSSIPWGVFALIVMASIGVLMAAKALQAGAALATIAALAVASNLTSISSGFLVFGERLPSGGLSLAIWLAALILVMAALALIPASPDRLADRSF